MSSSSSHIITPIEYNPLRTTKELLHDRFQSLHLFFANWGEILDPIPSSAENNPSFRPPDQYDPTSSSSSSSSTPVFPPRSIPSKRPTPSSSNPPPLKRTFRSNASELAPFNQVTEHIPFLPFLDVTDQPIPLLQDMIKSDLQNPLNHPKIFQTCQIASFDQNMKLSAPKLP